METLPDEAQRRAAVESTRPMTVVEAAAGTGKTTLLVTRILQLLLKPSEPSLSLRQIAAITFTEKAAAELKRRLRDVLTEAVAKNQWQGRLLTPEERRRLEEALHEVELAQISTIHSFCESLLRERPVEAGVDPGHAVADPATQELLMAEAWDRWLERQLYRPAQPTTSPLALAYAADLKFHPSVAGTHRIQDLQTLGIQVLRNRDVFDPDQYDVSLEFLQDQLGHWLERFVEETTPLVQRCSEYSSPCPKDRLLNWWRRACQLRDKLSSRDFGAVLTAVEEVAQLDSNSAALQRWGGKENLEQMRQLVDRLRKRLQAFKTHPQFAALLRELKSLVDQYETLKRAETCLDFQDLLLRARDLLRTHPGIRRYFARRYRHLLIDEFQDTDPIQVEIACLLAGDLAPGRAFVNLFLVGDPKQSIYRFRRADIETYLEALERFPPEQTTRAELSCNFRCCPRIIAFVNAVFQDLIRRPQDGKYQPSYIALRPGPGVTDFERSGVYYVPPPPSLQGSRNLGVAELRRWEGFVLAQFVREAVEQGWPVRDSDGALRAIRFSDVAILMERMTGLEQYEEGFLAAGLPYRILGGHHYFQRLEIKVVRAAAQAIRNPRDAVSLVATLRSPLFAHSDEDLLLHRQLGGSFSYLEEIPETSPLRESLAHLRRLHLERHARPVQTTLRDLLETTGALEFFATLSDGASRVANLLLLLERCRELERTGMLTFDTFVGWLERWGSVEEEESEGAPLEEAEGPVQILTIHRAKGLEWPMVIVAGCSSGRTLSPNVPIVDRSQPGIAKAEFECGSWRTIGWPDAEQWERKRLEAERIRLFYVATTRARDYLVLPVGWPYRRHATAPAFEQYLGSLSRLERVPGPHSYPGGMTIHVVDTSRWDTPPELERQPRIDLHELNNPFVQRAKERLRADYRLLQDNFRRACEQANGGITVVRPSIDRPERLEPEPVAARVAVGELASSKGLHDHVEQERPRGADLAIGELVHWLLERAVPRSLPPQCFKEAAMARASTWGLTGSQIEEALALAQRAFEHPFLRQLLNRGRAYVEVPLAYRSDSGDADPQEVKLVEGSMDLVVASDDGVVLVDYKTDRVQPGQEGHHALRYLQQMQAYVEGLHRAVGRAPRAAYLFFVRTGQFVDCLPYLQAAT
jgi:ATP-dependent helicase/nuclease subunit A